MLLGNVHKVKLLVFQSFVKYFCLFYVFVGVNFGVLLFTFYPSPQKSQHSAIACSSQIFLH